MSQSLHLLGLAYFVPSFFSLYVLPTPSQVGHVNAFVLYTGLEFALTASLYSSTVDVNSNRSAHSFLSFIRRENTTCDICSGLLRFIGVSPISLRTFF